MQTRRLGKTEIKVSELVLGGGYVGGLLLHQDDETKRLAIRHAMEQGINFIDTAPSYGDGESERAIGWLLQEVEETPYISTKVAIDAATRNDLVGQIESSIHDSLARLQRNSVDLLQLHNRLGAEDDGPTLAVKHLFAKRGVIEGLENARSQGLTKYIGLTALGEIEPCRTAIESDAFDTAQVYYNLLNPSAAHQMPRAWVGQTFAGLIDSCRTHDVGVMNIRVFAAGILATNVRTGREIPITSEQDLSIEQCRSDAIFAALNDDNYTQAQTAIRFALAHEDISCVLVGVADIDQLQEAIAGSLSGPLPKSSIANLQKVYDSNFGLM